MSAAPSRGWANVFGWWWTTVRAQLLTTWNRIYRRMNEEGPTKELPKLSSFEDIKALLDQQEWRPDGIKTLGDATHSPEWLFARWGTLKEDCDCDDFAELVAKLVNIAGLSKEVYVCSVMWFLEAHAFVVLKDGDVWRWMDYGVPHPPMASLEEVLASVTKQYKPKERVIGWVLEPR